MSISIEQVFETLKSVQDPELHRDIVTLGMVKGLSLTGKKVKFTLALTTLKCPRKNEMVDAARNALLALEGIESVDIELGQLTPEELQRIISKPDKGKNLDMTDPERLKDVKRIIAVASGKGGVGKSTIAVNLAAGLASDGHSVGILDADIYGPSIPMMLAIDEQPSQLENKILPISKHGMLAISMGMFVSAGEALIWRGPMVMKAIQQFFDDVYWGELDYLVIDLPPGTGDAQLSMSQLIKVSGAVIVTTPQDISFLDVTRAVGMFQRVNVPIIGIVENMSYFKCPHCGEETEIFHKGSNYIQAGSLGYPLLAKLPMDTGLPISGDEGIPIVLKDPNSEIGTRLINLARKIHAEMEKSS
jgi:ATP-binding protein involved in chromosome partitioning